MTEWKHDGHEVIMLIEYARAGEKLKPGSRFGPYCVTCDELMLWFSVPYQEDLDKAALWVKRNRPDLLAEVEHHPPPSTRLK